VTDTDNDPRAQHRISKPKRSNTMTTHDASSRRSFLASAAGLGIAGIASGTLARRALAQAGTATPPVGAPAAKPVPMIVGSGTTRFEVLHDWLVPPADGAFGDTHGVAQDAQGNIYVAHTVGAGSARKDAVYVYSKDGAFLRSFGPEFAGGAHGLDLRNEDGTDFLYHCDTGRRKVVKTRLDGTVVWEAGCPMESGAYKSADQWCPTNVAFGPDGTVFVGDGYGASYIHAFTKDGAWKAIVARPGKDPGQVSCPHGMTVDARGNPFTKEPALCVADRGNRRIQYLSLDGKHLGFVTDGMRMPCDMKVRGDLLLVPDLESVVTILDKDNKPVTQLCDGHPSNLRGAPREQFIPGKFVHPHDAIWLANGDILVAEWVPIGRVTLLRAVR
jgi:hypothetical protein